MALITCPECSKQISDNAAACPHCGYAMTSAKVGADASREADHHRAIQRSEGKQALGKAVWMLGLPVAIVAGMMFGGAVGWPAAIGVLFLAALISYG